MTKLLAISEVRQQLPRLVDEARRLHHRVIVTQKGKPGAVILGIDEYESWVETLDLLSDPATVQAIRRGEADLKAGRFRSFEEVTGRPLHAKSKKR